MEALQPLLRLQEVSCCGGGRGVFAQTDIAPGTLLVKEDALITMPQDTREGEHLHLALARTLIAHPQQQSLLAATAPLHPSCLDNLPEGMLSELRAQHQQDVEELQVAQAAAAAAGSSLPPLTADELLRIMLVLRFNAHYSGLYLACEMFNHACNPNCIKLVTRRSEGRASSEIRALRPIRAGEECCISYLNPPLQSRARRQAHLEKQHLFSPAMPATVIATEPPLPSQQPHVHAQQPPRHATRSKACPLPEPLAEPCNTFPAVMEAWLDEGEPTQKQAADLQAIEQDLDDAEAALEAVHASLTAARGGMGATSGMAGDEAAAAVAAAAAAGVAQVLSSVEHVAQRAARILHPRHVVLARAHTLLVDASATLLAATSKSFASSGVVASPPKPHPESVYSIKGCSKTGCSKNEIPRPLSDPVAVALLLLRAGHELKATQDLYCGAQHYETAKLLLDMQQALEFLISSAPRQLYDAFPLQYGSFAKASKADFKLKQQHLRISSLYK